MFFGLEGCYLLFIYVSTQRIIFQGDLVMECRVSTEIPGVSL